MTAFVCIYRAFELSYPSWYLAVLLTITTVIVPRLIYFVYIILKRIQDSSNMPHERPNISIYHWFSLFGSSCYNRIIRPIVVSLVCIDPDRNGYPWATCIFKVFLLSEPLVHLAYWCLIQYPLNPDSVIYNLLLAILFTLYSVHTIIENHLLQWTIDAAISWKLCNRVIKICDNTLRLSYLKNENYSELLYGSSTYLQLLLDIFKDATQDYPFLRPEDLGITKADRMNSLINFYKNCFNHFSETQLKECLLENKKYIPTLLKFTMIKLTYALLNTEWNEQDEFNKAIDLVLSYIKYTSGPQKKVFKKMGTYCKVFTDPKQQFTCQGLIYKYNQVKMPTLIDGGQPEIGTTVRTGIGLRTCGPAGGVRTCLLVCDELD